MDSRFKKHILFRQVWVIKINDIKWEFTIRVRHLYFDIDKRTYDEL